MKKKYRVKKQKDFQAIFHHRSSAANRQFVIYQLTKKEQTYFRVGLSVSKKLGNAVVRNKIKRYMRQVMLEEREHIQTKKDYVIIARVPCVELKYVEFKKCLLHVLKKADIWQEISE